MPTWHDKRAVPALQHCAQSQRITRRGAQHFAFSPRQRDAPKPHARDRRAPFSRPANPRAWPPRPITSARSRLPPAATALDTGETHEAALPRCFDALGLGLGARVSSTKIELCCSKSSVKRLNHSRRERRERRDHRRADGSKRDDAPARAPRRRGQGTGQRRTADGERAEAAGDVTPPTAKRARARARRGRPSRRRSARGPRPSRPRCTSCRKTRARSCLGSPRPARETRARSG